MAHVLALCSLPFKNAELNVFPWGQHLCRDPEDFCVWLSKGMVRREKERENIVMGTPRPITGWKRTETHGLSQASFTQVKNQNIWVKTMQCKNKDKLCNLKILNCSPRRIDIKTELSRIPFLWAEQFQNLWQTWKVQQSWLYNWVFTLNKINDLFLVVKYT